MKKILFSLLFIASFNTIHAQILDEFDSNNYEWSEFSTKKSQAIIINGKMHMESSVDEPATTFCYAPIDITSDFDVKCDVLVKKIDDDNVFGLLLDYLDEDNYLAFKVTEGYACFEQYREGRRVRRYPPCQIKLKEQKKAHVELEVRKESNRFVFNINGVKAMQVHFGPNYEMVSAGLGFMIGGKQKVDFDNLKIEQ